MRRDDKSQRGTVSIDKSTWDHRKTRRYIFGKITRYMYSLPTRPITVSNILIREQVSPKDNYLNYNLKSESKLRDENFYIAFQLFSRASIPANDRTKLRYTAPLPSSSNKRGERIDRCTYGVVTCVLSSNIQKISAPINEMRFHFQEQRNDCQLLPPSLPLDLYLESHEKNGRQGGEKEREKKKEEEPRELGMVWLVTFSTNCFKFSSPFSPPRLPSS